MIMNIRIHFCQWNPQILHAEPLTRNFNGYSIIVNRYDKKNQEKYGMHWRKLELYEITLKYYDSNM